MLRYFSEYIELLVVLKENSEDYLYQCGISAGGHESNVQFHDNLSNNSALQSQNAVTAYLPLSQNLTHWHLYFRITHYNRKNDHTANTALPTWANEAVIALPSATLYPRNYLPIHLNWFLSYSGKLLAGLNLFLSVAKSAGGSVCGCRGHKAQECHTREQISHPHPVCSQKE